MSTWVASTSARQLSQLSSSCDIVVLRYQKRGGDLVQKMGRISWVQSLVGESDCFIGYPIPGWSSQVRKNPQLLSS
jgi:hypothetical protein